jgi:hypothetical protein
MLSKSTKPTKLLLIEIVENPLGVIAKTLDFRTYNTPKILQTSMFVIWGLGLIWIPTTIVAIQSQRDAVKRIAQDSIPSVVLAQRLIDAMSDMDTMVASALLDPKDKTLLSREGEPKTMQDSQQAFNKRRYDLTERLTKAANNITFPGEKEAIQQLMLDSGDYFVYLERSQAAHNQGNRAEALTQYKLAAQVLDRKFIPHAHQLRDINSDQLENQYIGSRRRGASDSVVVAILGLLTIGALVALQGFLYMRTRRTLNPLLLVTTIGALLFLLHALSVLMASGEQLRVLKEDSYNSLLSLRLARALLYSANSDESRYLLDPANQALHEAAFREKTNQVFRNSDDQAVLKQAIDNLKTAQPEPDKQSYFAKAINNITFSQERQPMIEMMKQYQEYMATDQDIRNLVAKKQQQAAVVLCLGKSNEQFDAMKKAMDDVKVVNEDIAKAVEERAMGELANFEVKATIALGAMATLVFFGLRPRMREYL